ncbi:MAG: transposase [Thaumarchaeota archaeon]|nr:transposase [Nitrososphaerota archaeon]
MVGFDGHKRIKGTKIHSVVTKESLPVTVTIGSGREHEGRKFIPVMESISIKGADGRPRRRPKILYADTKYNMPLNIFYLDGKHIKSQMPEVSTKKRRPGRPRLFNKTLYNKVRSMIERFYGWMKAFRRIIIRYERLPSTYLGFVQLGCVVILLR